MPWFKVDDQVHGHPKHRKAGLAAVGLWSVSGSYCRAYPELDGVVPRWYVDSWPNGRKLAARLVASGLWEPRPEGWYFHDWPDYQPTVDEIAEMREKARQRQRRHRQAKTASKVNGHHPDPDVTPFVTRDRHVTVTSPVTSPERDQ